MGGIKRADRGGAQVVVKAPFYSDWVDIQV